MQFIERFEFDKTASAHAHIVLIVLGMCRAKNRALYERYLHFVTFYVHSVSYISAFPSSAAIKCPQKVYLPNIGVSILTELVPAVTMVLAEGHTQVTISPHACATVSHTNTALSLS